MGRKKKEPQVQAVAKVNVAEPATSDYTVAVKRFIEQNFNKMSTEEVAESCGLSVQQVLDYVHNVERDVKVTKRKNKYGPVDGVTIMTEARAAAADKAFRENPTPDLTKIYGKDVVPIEFKHDH